MTFKYILILFVLVLTSCSRNKIPFDCSDKELFERVHEYLKENANDKRGEVVSYTWFDGKKLLIENDKGELKNKDDIASAASDLYRKYKIDEVGYSHDFDFTLFRYNKKPTQKWWYEQTFLLFKDDLVKLKSTYDVLDSNDCFYLISPIEEIQMIKRLIEE